MSTEIDFEQSDIQDKDIIEAAIPVHSETLGIYYKHLFPFKELFLWLNHGQKPNRDFIHREFAFTLSNDAYLRYLSFSDSALLQAEACKMRPSRFEIGPVYSNNPKDRKSLRKVAFKAIEKEFVLDIDLTDYDSIRTCCSKAEICTKCWNFITVACEFLDQSLREDFGFQSILWVYSGRRGIHAWICDKRARKMDDTTRKCIMSFYDLGRTSSHLKDIRRPLHPVLTKAFLIFTKHFKRVVLEGQDPWATEEGANKLLEFIPDQILRDALKKKWAADPGRSSYKKWADIDSVAETGVSKTLNTTALMNAKENLVFEYLYPRLDSEVSKHLNHLLKSPFCVHPGTGRVCVPIASRDLQTFNPLLVPTLAQLISEIESLVSDIKIVGSGILKTSLVPYIETFKSFRQKLISFEKENIQPDYDF